MGCSRLAAEWQSARRPDDGTTLPGADAARHSVPGALCAWAPALSDARWSDRQRRAAGNRNAWRHGEATAAAVDRRRTVRPLLRELNDGLTSLAEETHAT